MALCLYERLCSIKAVTSSTLNSFHSLILSRSWSTFSLWTLRVDECKTAYQTLSIIHCHTYCRDNFIKSQCLPSDFFIYLIIFLYNNLYVLNKAVQNLAFATKILKYTGLRANFSHFKPLKKVFSYNQL